MVKFERLASDAPGLLILLESRLLPWIEQNRPVTWRFGLDWFP
jgi:hypothetical protein